MVYVCFTILFNFMYKYCLLLLSTIVIAEKLAMHGAKGLVLWDLHTCEDTMAQIKKINPECQVFQYQVDVSNVERVQAAAKEVASDLNAAGVGHVSCVVNNAGKTKHVIHLFHPSNYICLICLH